MNKKLLLVFINIFCLFATAHSETDYQPIADTQKQAVIDSITADYYDWTTISMSGKLSSDLLPVSPSVKVYMEKEKLTIISISAPLVGEVGRMEIDEEGMLIVNKMSNTYTQVASEIMESICPGGLEALQNLLLGRITIIGKGELCKKLDKSVDIYDNDPNLWMLVPKQDFENASYAYMYAVNRDNYLLNRFLVLTETTIQELECTYIWTKKDMTLNFQAFFNEKSNSMGATLKLNNPDSQAKKITRMQLSSKYRQTDLKGILK